MKWTRQGISLVVKHIFQLVKEIPSVAWILICAIVALVALTLALGSAGYASAAVFTYTMAAFIGGFTTCLIIFD